MLEAMRRRSAGVILWIVFGILIAVFVFSSPLTADGGGCLSSPKQFKPLTVDGDDLSLNDWRFAFNATSLFTSGGGSKRQRTEGALEILLRRELLAAEAERRGLSVSDAVVDEKLKNGEIYLLGNHHDGKQIYFTNGFFDYDKLRLLVANLELSMAAFKAQQRREILADMLAEILRAGPLASRDEAFARFLHEQTQVTIDVVKFAPTQYEAALRLTDADVERFLAGHEAEVKKQFETEERTYKGVKPQVLVRQIFVAKAAATPPAEAAPTTPPTGAAPTTPPAAAPTTPAAPAAVTDAGLVKLEAARADIAAKKKSFAEVAAALDSDERRKLRGGLLGWKTAEAPGLEAPELSAALKDLDVGEVSPVITTARGYYLLTVDGKREGDLGYDQVKLELADKLAGAHFAREAARRAAVAALSDARAGKNLEDLFERQAPQQQGIPPEQLLELLQDPNTDEATKQQIMQMLQQQMGGGAQGALDVETIDIPAKSQAPEAEAETGAAAAPAAKPAATPTATTPAAKPTATTTAAPTATTTAAPTATTTAAPAAGAGADSELMKPSTEALPTFGEMAKPKVQRLEGIVRDRKTIPRIGDSQELVGAIFDELAAGNLARQIYEVKGDFVVVQVITKQDAKIEDFDKDADKLVQSLRAERGERFLGEWLGTRCNALADAKKISANVDLVQDYDEQNRKLPITYRPCQSMQ